MACQQGRPCSSHPIHLCHLHRFGSYPRGLSSYCHVSSRTSPLWHWCWFNGYLGSDLPEWSFASRNTRTNGRPSWFFNRYWICKWLPSPTSVWSPHARASNSLRDIDHMIYQGFRCMDWLWLLFLTHSSISMAIWAFCPGHCTISSFHWLSLAPRVSSLASRKRQRWRCAGHSSKTPFLSWRSRWRSASSSRSWPNTCTTCSWPRNGPFGWEMGSNNQSILSQKVILWMLRTIHRSIYRCTGNQQLSSRTLQLPWSL